jgi:hypothetical protein
VFTPVAENFACNGCGTMYGSGETATAEPRCYTFTREQLIDALTRHRPSLRNPEAVADALIEALEAGQLTAKLSTNPEYQSALRDAESESWDGPGIGGAAMIDAATERRRAWRASLRGGSAAREGEPGG